MGKGVNKHHRIFLGVELPPQVESLDEQMDGSSAAATHKDGGVFSRVSTDGPRYT